MHRLPDGVDVVRPEIRIASHTPPNARDRSSLHGANGLMNNHLDTAAFHMPTLRPLSSVTAQTAIVVCVASKGSSLFVDVDLQGSNSPRLRVDFHGLVSYRVLDERDLPPHWHGARDAGVCRGCLLYEVTSGGWADDQKAQSPAMAAGFYPKLREWVVVSDDWCVSVLSESDSEPCFSER